MRAYARTPEGKAARKAANDTYRKRHAIKYKANNKVNNALRDGKITKPTDCADCGGELELHAHHDDYTKPLDVRWLCDPCHKEWHRNNKPITGEENG